MPATPSAILRSGTHAAHQRIEGLPGMRRIFAADYSRAECVDLLNRLWRVHHALDRRLGGGGGEAQAIAFVPRGPLLRDGLRALGAEPASSTTPPALPVFDTAAARWGGLYVVEGSILGGRLLHRRLSEAFADAPPEAFAFFVPYDDTARQWRHVCAQLDQSLTPPSALASAQATFAAFHAALEHGLPGRSA